MRILLLLVIFVLAGLNAYSQEGAPDSSFGKNGYATADFPPPVNLQANKGIKVLRKSDNTYYLVFTRGTVAIVAHYFSDGKLDSSYGNKGYSEPSPVNTTSAAIQADDKVIIAGSIQLDYSTMFAASRFNTDGKLDNTFGNNGTTFTDFGNRFAGSFGILEAVANCVAVQTDGKIVLGGFQHPPTSPSRDIAFVRYNADGSPDSSFGYAGKKGFSFNTCYPSDGYINAIAVQPDGKVVAGGLTKYCDPQYNQRQFTVLRLMANGNLDSSFGNMGKAVANVDNRQENQVNLLKILNDGKILAGGSSYWGYYSFLLTRFNSNGSIDSGFSAKPVESTYGSSFLSIRSFDLLSDGKILAGGTNSIKYSSNDQSSALFIRYLPSGKMDSAFGGAGMLTTSLNDSSNRSGVNSLVAESTGKIITAGWVDDNYAIVRYSSNFSPDSSFGKAGRVTSSIRTGYTNFSKIAMSPAGKMLALGTTVKRHSATGTSIYDTILSKFGADGVVDSSFGVSGKVILNSGANVTAFQSDEKVLVGGGDTSFRLFRYNANGLIDSSFGLNGKVETDVNPLYNSFITALGLQNDGKIVAGGVSSDIVRYQSSGILDTTFGSNGRVNAGVGEVKKIWTTEDSKIVVQGAKNFTRLNYDGTLDTNFLKHKNDFGYANAIALQQDNKVLVLNQGSGTLVLERYNTDGTRDNSFGGSGTATLDRSSQVQIAALVVGNDEKILILGHRYNAGKNNYDLVIWRYYPTGYTDNNFGSYGRITVPVDMQIASLSVTGDRIIIAGSRSYYGVNGAIGMLKHKSAATFYSKASGNLNDLTTWGNNANGSGTIPSNFDAGKVFMLRNRTSYILNNNWTVAGAVNIAEGTSLQLNGKTLGLTQIVGLGTLSGTPASNLILNGYGTGLTTLRFAKNAENLNELRINRTASATTTLATPLNIYGALVHNGGSFNTNDFLTLRSTLAGTARIAPLSSTATITGKAIIERYIPNRRAWRLLSAPVEPEARVTVNAWQEGVTTASPNPNPNPGYGTQLSGGSSINGFDTGSFVSVKRYNNTNDTWIPLTNTNLYKAGALPYMTFVNGDRSISSTNTTVPAMATTLRVKGTLRTGSQAIPVEATGYTAVANPYASPINFATISKNSVQNSFWVWDPKLGGTYGVGAWVNVSWNGTSYDVTPASISPESQYIQSGQGFMVKSTGVAGSIVIKESDKSATPTANVFRQNSSAKQIRMTLKTSENDKEGDVIDETVAAFGAPYADKVDELDVPKLPNIKENISVARGDKSLMVDRRSEIEGEALIQLKLWNTEQKSYRFEIYPSNLSSAQSATLEDTYLHTSVLIDLNSVTQYTFAITADPASQNPYRFKIVLNAKRSLPGMSTVDSREGIKVFPNPIKGKTINVDFSNEPKGNYDVELSNSKGQRVMVRTVYNEGGTFTKAIELNNVLAKGVYTLKVSKGRLKSLVQIIKD